MVTQRDIAKALNLSQATVSLALQNNPRISASIRDKVQRFAKENGYRLDPALSALAAYRSGKRSPGFQGTVAWLTNFSERDGWQVDAFVDYYKGAKEFFANHGYQLDSFWLREPRMTWKRLSQILKSRGIECVLICPQELSGTRLDHDFSDFAVVTFGYSLASPRFHTVTAQGFTSMRTLYHNLRAQKHKRIGFVYFPEIEHRAQGSWLGGYHVARDMHNDPLIPPLAISELNSDQLTRWIRDNRIDAVIATHESILQTIANSKAKDVNLPAPYLTVSRPEIAIGGMVFDNKRIGEIAARKVISLYHSREFGEPPIFEFTAIEGTFKATQNSALLSV